jgi:hypothetical protein
LGSFTLTSTVIAVGEMTTTLHKLFRTFLTCAKVSLHN